MSFAVDANVLLYASDTTSPHGEGARRFLERAASGAEIMCLSWSTVMAYLRIATHPAIFAHPLTPAEASANVDALLGLPHVRRLAEGEGFWDVYRDVTHGLTIRGNLVPDAHLAALLRQHGVTRLYTRDADFRKFRFLDVLDPLKAPTSG